MIADVIGKAVVMLSSHSPHSFFRKDVQAYIRAREYLISVASVQESPPFTDEELQVLEYYVQEMARVLRPLTK
jgi:hypothetical protein